MEIRGISGQFNSTLDEKGRILIPSKLREKLNGIPLILTRGLEKCLWLFPEEEWQKVTKVLLDNSSLFKARSQMIQRRLIAPATEIGVDRNGRLNIPSSLQKRAGLVRDCILIGLDDHVEIWDEDLYVEFEEKCDLEIKDAWEELGKKEERG